MYYPFECSTHYIRNPARRAGAMQDAVRELRRIPLPRTSVNRGSWQVRKASLCGMLLGASSNRHMQKAGALWSAKHTSQLSWASCLLGAPFFLWRLAVLVG